MNSHQRRKLRREQATTGQRLTLRLNAVDHWDLEFIEAMNANFKKVVASMYIPRNLLRCGSLFDG